MSFYPSSSIILPCPTIAAKNWFYLCAEVCGIWNVQTPRGQISSTLPWGMCLAWCMVQLIKAVQLGYTIVHVHKVWHFPKTNSIMVFFLASWSSGSRSRKSRWATPVGCVTKTKLVQEYREWEQISLDLTMIQKNPGCKATAKLKLSFFWDKFRENLHKPTTFQLSPTPWPHHDWKEPRIQSYSQTEAELRLG